MPETVYLVHDGERGAAWSHSDDGDVFVTIVGEQPGWIVHHMWDDVLALSRFLTEQPQDYEQDVTPCSRVRISYGPMADRVDRSAGGAIRDYVYFVVPTAVAEVAASSASEIMRANGQDPSEPTIEEVGHRVEGEYWTVEEVHHFLRLKMGWDE